MGERERERERETWHSLSLSHSLSGQVCLVSLPLSHSLSAQVCMVSLPLSLSLSGQVFVWFLGSLCSRNRWTLRSFHTDICKKGCPISVPLQGCETNTVSQQKKKERMRCCPSHNIFIHHSWQSVIKNSPLGGDTAAIATIPISKCALISSQGCLRTHITGISYKHLPDMCVIHNDTYCTDTRYYIQ